MGDLYNPFPKLPKNIRQIGDSDQVIRFYMEDYVNTYLKRLYPTGSQTLRVGLLLGSVEQYDGTPYIFVDGAMEMEDVETDGEKIIFSENSWKKAYQAIEEAFPKRTIQGWFLCGGPGSQLSPLNYWKQHGQYFAGRNQLMYLNHGLEGEEAIYITSEDGFYRLKGHCIYYERNQMMQDYMITRKDVRRVESGSHEKVIKDFRQRMTVKKEQAAVENHKTSALGMLCGVLSVSVLAGGVVLFNNYGKMQRMESVLTSVLPAGVSDWDEYGKQKAEEPDFIIEEMPGNVYPTQEANQGATGETGESYGMETMSSDLAEADSDLVEEAVPTNQETSAEAGGSEASAASGEGGSEAGAASGEGVGSEAGAASGEGGSEAGAASGQGEGSEAGAAAGEGEGKGSKAGAAAESEQGGQAKTQEEAEKKLVGMGKEEGQGDTSEADVTPIDYEAAEANGYEIYQVGEGETLYGICWKLFGDLKHLGELCRLNRLEDENKILAGQKLILPQVSGI